MLYHFCCNIVLPISDDISCTFELGLCSWSNDVSNAAVNWKRFQGSTQSLDTGPSDDVSGGRWSMICSLNINIDIIKLILHTKDIMYIKIDILQPVVFI